MMGIKEGRKRTVTGCQSGARVERGAQYGGFPRAVGSSKLSRLLLK